MRTAYINHCSLRLSPKTVKSYAITLDSLIAHVGDLYVENLRADHIEGFLASLRVDHIDANRIHRKPINAKSFNGYVSRLAPFTKWMTTRGMTKVDLMANVQRMTEHRPVKTRLTSDQVWAMLDATQSPRDRALLALAVHTGMRSGEIVTLRIGDLDLDGGVLRVEVWKSRMTDEMPLSDDLTAELRMWLAEYGKDVMRSSGRILRSEDFLIPGLRSLRFTNGFVTGPDGRQRRATVAGGYEPGRACFKAAKVVQRALARIGVESAGEGVHTLRRTSARLLFDRLVSKRGHDGALRVVSSYLHHASTATTEGYLGLTQELKVRDDFLRTEGLLGPRPQDADVVTLP